MAEEFVLYGHLLPRGVFHHLHGDPRSTRLYDDRAGVHQVWLRPVEEGGEYWGWWDNERQSLRMVYPGRQLLEMCFAYGSRAEVDRGRGQVVNLEFVEAKHWEG